MFLPAMAAAAASSSFANTAPHTILSCHRRCRGARTAFAARRRRHAASATVLGRRPPRCRPLLAACAGSDGGGGAAEANPKHSPPPLGMEESSHNTSSGQGYIGLFVRMLGLDNDPLDREHAIVTLWKYSLGGKKCIDEIMQFPGCTNLVVSLLKSDSSTTCEAAAGLLRTVSSVNLYVDVISESGAIEEITGLLCQCPLAPEVKEQSLCTLWNLSIDDKVRLKLANSDFVPELVKFLDDEDIKVKEAAGGILANLSINPRNHSLMVEAGVISKLADLLNSDADGFSVIRKEAKFALLELSKDEYYRILIIEEGLIRVPVIGAAAYKSFRSRSHSWPSLPDGSELQVQRNSRPSRYGASELLLGLNVNEKFNLEEAKMNAIVGRSHQQFLARIGAIEMEDGKVPQMQPPKSQKHTLLPWIDGIARLVLILGLEDESAVTRAAYSIADASISEHMRISFREAGAIKPLLQLLSHDSEAIREAVASALEKLCVSYEVCRTMEAEGALNPLINILKNTSPPKILLEKTVSILSRILDSTIDMERKPNNQVINESAQVLSSTRSSGDIGVPLTNMDISVASQATKREKVIDSEVISCLVNLLRTSCPKLQTKVASVLEYISAFESHTITITESGIETALDTVFEQAPFDGTIEDQLELDPVEAEEIGHATAAAARLLTKLLNSQTFCRSINGGNFVPVLRKVLKSDIPLHSKEWIAACLVKLESLLGPGTGSVQSINIEVTLYEKIPKLVQQMMTSFSYESKEAAVLELSEVLSRGGVECTREVAAAGGIFPLVKLIEEGRGQALEASLKILYSLSMDSENHAAIIAAGAVAALKRIIISKGPQSFRALRLLRTLPT
ncbi:uncharacterized protein M6B38_189860 [Iris pallida]|uniref:Armadillo repeat-containing domain-containing protein n=1 Tax=Iris pallida TaxID=29817 RepID=A0AAX6EIB1_IRIPA|nr:uncharacterized protein M6B38_189860 [Iris pallida]